MKTVISVKAINLRKIGGSKEYVLNYAGVVELVDTLYLFTSNKKRIGLAINRAYQPLVL